MVNTGVLTAIFLITWKMFPILVSWSIIGVIEHSIDHSRSETIQRGIEQAWKDGFDPQGVLKIREWSILSRC